TNLSQQMQIVTNPKFVDGAYDTNFMRTLVREPAAASEPLQRDLAVAAAVAYLLRNQQGETTLPDRFRSGWHRSSRRLPI
ncbi:MAG: hypothetical protein KDD78_20510, partial [Caldilineaceae bacterium]|nr:hypothetical protein [Caldilineaceae bacterium]